MRWCFRSIVLLVCAPAFLLAQIPSLDNSNQGPKVSILRQGLSQAVAGAEQSSDAPPAQSSGASSANDSRFTVSVTSLAAPDKAKKAFERGEEEVRKGKFEAAASYLRKAVDMYPRYAIAWLELGRVRSWQSSFADAQQCFRQAVAQDAKLLDGYVELAHVDAQQQDWRDLAHVTDHLLEVAPAASAEYWFLNSAAYYNLDNLQRAETSITAGLRLDSRHEVAQMEYLYGLILGSKKQYKQAAEHVSAYLRLAPDAPDREAAQNLLAAYQYRAKRVENGEDQ
ncbi:MAG: tetratricopeptide repeat protein [Acidobacteria bacterium]|nr:tetratricopeptide repeat protein [Acidobacteriota bacterium]